MKILNITTYRSGGAGIASLRIHKKLIEQGFNSKIYFLEDIKESLIVILIKKIIKFFNKYILLKKEFLKDEYLFINNTELLKKELNKNLIKEIKNIDIIFIHWISNHMNSYDINNLHKITNARIIFVMMDLAHITGGCHYPLNCLNYIHGCIDCPALKYEEKQLAFNQHLTKSINVAKFKGEIISFSDKDMIMAKNSSIPFYKFWRLDIPFDKPKPAIEYSNNFTILPSAYSFYNSRKGINNLKQILYILENKLLDDETIIIYNTDYPKSFTKDFIKIKFKKFKFYSDTNTLQELYNASNLLLFTSIADSAPQMVLEALMSNIHVYTYNVGYVSELINNENGKIVENYNAHEMANSIYSFFKNYKTVKDDLVDFTLNKNISKYFNDNNFKSQINKILNDV